MVFDDVLNDEAAASVWTYIQVVKYHLLHEKEWSKDWRLHDGMPRVSDSVCYARSESETADAEHYTHTAIDFAIAAIVESASRTPFIASKPWTQFDAAVFIYPQGAGLSWHCDHPEYYAGSFIYYAHPFWNVEWGGELMVQREPDDGYASLYAGSVMEVERKDGELISAKRRPIESALDNTSQNQVLLAQGHGQFFYPSPNRLVLLRAAVPHRIRAVTPAAGMHPRVSIAGFFKL